MQEQQKDVWYYIFLLLRNWYWLALSLVIAMTITWGKLRYSTNIYSIYSTILINDDQKKSLSEEALVEQLGIGYESGSSNVDDELQILKSSRLMRQVIDSMDINITYFTEGRLKDTEQYGLLPVRLVNAEPIDMAYGRNLRVKALDENKFMLVPESKDTVTGRFGIPFTWGDVSFTIERNQELSPQMVYSIRIDHPDNMARAYAGKLSVNTVDFGNVISLSMNDPVPNKAMDVLNTLILEYDNAEIEEKSEAGKKTLDFIDERLSFITVELYDVEKEVEGFKNTRDLPVTIDSRAENYLEQASVADEQLMELNLRQDMLRTIEQRLKDKDAQYKTLPISSEILSGVLGELVKNYNELIYQRDKILKSATGDNPAATSFNEKLLYLKENILLSIGTMRQELQSRKKTLEARLAPLERQISAVPRNQRELLQIMRQQQIKESLFLFLLQKREETALSIAAQTSSSRILNPPTVGGLVSPDRGRMYLTALLLGLIIPAGSIYLFEIFDNKVRSRQDIFNETQIPFLGIIGHTSKDSVIVVKKGSRSSIAEMFRLLRTNLQFTATGTGGKVLLVTSSISGEGKSFVSINIAASQALSGKRTLLVGLDLRKPKMSKYLTGEAADRGVTNYLVGEGELSELIRPVEGFSSLDYIDCGPVPPNPAELLMTDELKTMFEKLRAQYDFIVIDTSPIALVTDALLLKDVVDHTLVVIRFGKSTKGLLRVLDDVYRGQKLPKMGIVLNGVRAIGSYGYHYGHDYGYGYGYGNTNGYYEEDTVPKRKKLFSFKK